MAVYANFDFYIETFGGTAIAAADFNALVIRASREIDYLTFDRASAVIEANTDTDTIEAIRLATCAVAEMIQAINDRSGQIQSEKVGSHSVTYTPTPSNSLSDDGRISLAAKRYLAKTGLMYRGFNSGEYAGAVSEEDL
jgi:hypothetical protein